MYMTGMTLTFQVEGSGPCHDNPDTRLLCDFCDCTITPRALSPLLPFPWHWLHALALTPCHGPVGGQATGPPGTGHQPHRGLPAGCLQCTLCGGFTGTVSGERAGWHFCPFTGLSISVFISHLAINLLIISGLWVLHPLLLRDLLARTPTIIERIFLLAMWLP